MRKAFLGIAMVLLIVTRARGQQGDVFRVHDPSIIKSGNTYFIFSTGNGLSIRTSTDLFNWKYAGSIFENAPDWTRPYLPRGNNLWAPDISLCSGEYRVYYAASTFGNTHSCIGLATNKTLDATSPDYHWIDRGKVIDTPEKNRWNALDPCAFVDRDQKDWLILGSCWTGIKIIPLDSATGLCMHPDNAPLTLASRPPGLLLEEGYIRAHGEFYYLWMSYDHCCRGVNSDYKIVVARSKEITGPYIDRDNVPTLKGGGTVVLSNAGSVRGPGSCAILHEGNQDFIVHHCYDADNRGIPRLQIRPLTWDADGWPVAGDLIKGPVSERTADSHSVH